MARSTYIYLIRCKQSQDLLAAFTVKYQAHTWAFTKYGRDFRNNLNLSRMRDGGWSDGEDHKVEKLIEWDKD